MNTTKRIESDGYFSLNLFSVEKQNGWLTFVIVSGAYGVLTFIANNYIFVDQIYYRSFSDQLTLQSIQSILDIRERLWWLNYISQPVIILLKVSFTTVCISIGAVLTDLEFNFKTIFKVVLLAEGVFLIAQIIYMINMVRHFDVLTLSTSVNYFPLSVIGLLGTDKMVFWLQYPLQTFNLFEALYMVAISWLLSVQQWKYHFVDSLGVVVSSYGIGLILWLVLVTFLTLQIS